MDFPSDDWTVFAADEFELATCRDPGILGVELMAQARANGRIIDHFKLVVGGTEELAVEFKMADLFNIRSPPEWTLVYKLQPADIKIRRNMSTSTWQDIRDLVAAREIVIIDEDSEEVVEAAFLALFEGTSSSSTPSTSLRWAICVATDHRVSLRLQALPYTATTISNKPFFMG